MHASLVFTIQYNQNSFSKLGPGLPRGWPKPGQEIPGNTRKSHLQEQKSFGPKKCWQDFGQYVNSSWPPVEFISKKLFHGLEQIENKISGPKKALAAIHPWWITLCTCVYADWEHAEALLMKALLGYSI